MDLEIEQKDIKPELLENRLGITDSKVIEEMNRLGLSEISSKRKNDRIKDRLNNSFVKNKYNKNENNKD